MIVRSAATDYAACTTVLGWGGENIGNEFATVHNMFTGRFSNKHINVFSRRSIHEKRKIGVLLNVQV